MRRALLALAVLPLILLAQHAEAQAPLTLRYGHLLFTLQPLTAWKRSEEAWTLRGQPFMPPQELRVDGDDLPPLPPGVAVQRHDAWDLSAIRAALTKQIAPQLRREAGTVTIKGSGSGKLSFDGVGLTGRDLDLDRATRVVAAALEHGIVDVFLPVNELQPIITMENPRLADTGIREVIAVGESDFSNSPANRRHNIATGLAKFNGQIIPQGTVFSFDKILGRVDDTTGYLKELVIKGDRTIPDYGGGLCQVSTTAYRGVWEYGFPIVKRINHSYSVSHYFPQGTDATVFPPYVDMQFMNDSPGALAIQTYAQGDRAYFIFYGTKDDRVANVVGPFTWDPTPPPPDRVEYTTEIPPGETKKMNERIPGVKALWTRIVRRGGEDKVEHTYSFYQARPLFTLVGVVKNDNLQFGSGSGGLMPSVYLEE